MDAQDTELLAEALNKLDILDEHLAHHGLRLSHPDPERAKGHIPIYYGPLEVATFEFNGERWELFTAQRNVYERTTDLAFADEQEAERLAEEGEET